MGKKWNGRKMSHTKVGKPRPTKESLRSAQEKKLASRKAKKKL